MVSGKILIVDDDAELRGLLAKILRDSGAEVAEAADGIEALQLLSESVFDVVVTDAEMPNCGGVELMGKLDRQTSGPRPALVLISRHLDILMEPRQFEADALISKPIEAEELEDAIHEALAKSAGRKA